MAPRQPDALPVAIGVMTEDESLEALLEGVRAAEVAGPERVHAALRRAVIAALAGQREEAESAIRIASEARGSEVACELELTSAFVMLEAGDATRALGAIARARDSDPTPTQRRWAGVLDLEASYPDESPAILIARIKALEPDLEALGIEPAGMAARLGASRVAHALGRRDILDAQLRALAGATRTGLIACDYEALRAELLLDQQPPDPDASRASLSRAVWRLVRIAAPRRLGLAYLAMARVEAVAGRDPAAPALWLARAQPLLLRGANARDLELLRRAFRLYGRRQLDRLVDADLGTAIDALRARHARLRDVLAAARDARNAKAADVPNEAAALDALEAQEELVIAALEGVLVDRERVGQLVRVTQQLTRNEGSRALLETLPKLALELCAGEGAEVHERAREDGPLVVVSKHGAPLPYARARLEREILEAIEDGQGRLCGQESYQPRGTGATGGRMAIIPLALASGAGALVVGRASRGGQIGDRDLERLTIYSSLASASLDRARATEALSEAAARDGATLEAIRDGIVTFDEEGAIRSMNRAAARLLRVTREESIGRTLSQLPSLAPLAAALAEPKAADGEVVALSHGDLLLRARPYEGGVVATVQELQSAQRIAQKLVGNSARFTFQDLVGRDPGFRAMLDSAQRAARSDVAILVTGESGTGKEMLAQAIHNASPRSNAPFIGINVAAIPRELLESELFGYERGAFTGARSGGMVGKLELAGEGTLLLDEIGDMPWEMQAKLLRVLQERSVVRLGGSREVPIKARIVATTHKDLDLAVREGTFRLDLFYRLRGVHVRLPALRERLGDVPMLVEHYLARVAEREGRLPLKVAPPLMNELVSYDWPGNVRELATLVEAEASLASAEATELTHTPAAMTRALARRGNSSAPPRPPSVIIESDQVVPLAEVEKRVFAHALRHFAGNVAKASRALGVSRGTFYNKMKLYGLGETEERS
jgi:transcriptional regulator with PAS, ATPase and Fis domain